MTINTARTDLFNICSELSFSMNSKESVEVYKYNYCLAVDLVVPCF